MVSMLMVTIVVHLPWSAQSMRVSPSLAIRNPEELQEPEKDTSSLSCCCKKEYCGGISKSTSTTEPVFSPNYNLCCKFKTWSCGNLLNGMSTKYTKTAPSREFCLTAQTKRFEDAEADLPDEPLVPIEDLTEGSPAHTVQSYCSFDHEVDVEDDAAPRSAAAPQEKAKDGIVKALVQELSGNSLDAMAKDIFSMYVCMRWAPTPAFVRAAQGEMNTKQLEEKSTYEHFDAFTFIPMRCSKNIHVYGNNPSLGETHFEQFEKLMLAQIAWYKDESMGAVPKRLSNMQLKTGDDLKEAAAAFDITLVRKAVAACEKNGDTSKNMTVDTVKANTQELLKDCVAAKWWLEKMEDWDRSMPFTSFMSPDSKVVKDTKPKSNEHLLVCFGKRVSSQLHRRAEGDHLITDQSMVGCHGFWKFTEAADMLERIVHLWRPPTCQLASMELDMKVKIMEMVATMNTQLFDALPAMLDDEASSKVVDEDGVPLKAANAPGVFMGLAKSIESLFSGMSSKYTRLGQMLGSTTVKWVVCPLKPITDPEKLEKLDMALGTEDDLTRYYAQTAYKKWTGKTNLLPGEECIAFEGVEREQLGPLDRHLIRCSVGEMRENMPERYGSEEFLCPVRPLLPAKQQLDVLQKKRDVCPIHMTNPQMKVAKWFYRGRRPHTKQYEVMTNFPEKQFPYVKILDMASHYDNTYYITRTFVTIGLGCTEEEAVLTPRFCSKPEVANENSVVRDLLTGMAVAGSAVAGGVGKALQVAGVTEATPPNKAYQQRTMAWLSGQAKSSERWLRSGTDGVFGRSAGRYKKRHTRSFAVVEAAELLHSFSFQSKFDESASDSKGNKRFDRFAVMSPCEGFDPNREFRLKYSQSEKSLTIARKAFQKLDKGIFTGGGFKVQLRSNGVLRMQDAETAWMNYFAHFRAASVGEDFSEWHTTNNPYMLDMVGIFDGHSDVSVDVDDLLGFEATFACGTRVAMHNLPVDFTSNSGSFRDCVKTGKLTNQQLRKESPDALFLKDEVVVRVTFKSLPACQKDIAASIAEEEKENPVYKNFHRISGCQGVSDTLPSELEGAKSDGTYRGMLLGEGLPKETLLEVLVDPADFLEEVTIK